MTPAEILLLVNQKLAYAFLNPAEGYSHLSPIVLMLNVICVCSVLGAITGNGSRKEITILLTRKNIPYYSHDTTASGLGPL